MNLSQKVALNTTLLGLGRLAVAGSGLVGVAVSTRYLGPTDFGQLTVAIVFVSVFGFLTDGGLYTVAVRELAKRPDEERRLLANVFSVGLMLTAGAMVVATAIMFVAYGGGGRGLVRLGIVILGAQMLVSALGGTASAYLFSRQRAAPMALAAVVSSVAFMLCRLVVVELDLGFAGIAGCFAVSGLITLLLPVIALRSVRFGLARDTELWRQIFAWALPQAGVLVLGVLYFRLDTFLLSFLASDAEVARYGLAYRVLEVLMLVPLYLMSTLFPEIARQRVHSPRLNEIVQGAFSAVVVAAVPVTIVFAGFAEDVVAVAGGPGYANSASVLRVLTLAVALLFVNTIFFQALVALSRHRNLLILLLTVLVANVVLNLFLIPPLGALGAAISLVASEGVVLVLVMRTFAEVGRVPRLTRVLRFTGAAVGAAGVVLALRSLLPVARPEHGLGTSFTAALGPLATLVAAAVVTTVLWLGALAVLHAFPTELRAALAALRHRSTPDPVSAPPPVGG